MIFMALGLTLGLAWAQSIHCYEQWNHSLCSVSGTKVRVESSSVQIVLPHPIPVVRNEKNNGEQFHCIY